MSFTGNEGESISLSTAADMTLSFRNSITNILTSLLNPNYPLSHTLDKDNLLELLDQEDCVGARFYHTIESNGHRTLVVVGADANEDDLDGGIILDKTGTSISLSAAATLTQSFRTSITNVITQIINPDIPIGHFIGKNNLQDVLEQENCVSLRVYYGLDGDNKKSLILIGVNIENEDLDEGLIMDNLDRCPPKCSAANSLNTTS